MDREILFRGMRCDNCEWACGNLMVWGSGKTEIFSVVGKKGVAFNEVFPTTVGQYTGFKDRNGKRIFEGDVIEYDTFIGTWVKTVRAVVVWDRSAWALRQTGYSFLVELDGVDDMDVVGNIHDNPELMEV